MKFRLKIGHLFGALNPESNNGRTYGMYMVPWIKSVKEELDLGLKETKSLADCLRDSIEKGHGTFSGASVDVDIVQFPFLEKCFYRPSLMDATYIEPIKEYEAPGLACTVGPMPSKSVEIIQEAMRKLLDINAWDGVRRLSEVLMDIEDAQSV